MENKLIELHGDHEAVLENFIDFKENLQETNYLIDKAMETKENESTDEKKYEEVLLKATNKAKKPQQKQFFK